VRRPAAARVAGAVLAAVTAVALALTGVASAASLKIMAQDGSTVFVQTDARCTDATLEVAPSGSSSGGSVGALTISGDLGSCAGGDILVLDAEGTILFSAPVTVAGGVGSAEGLAFPAHQASGVVLRLDGWVVPAEWRAPEPEPSSAIRCYPVDPSVTAECDVVVTSWNHWSSGYRLDFRVESSSAQRFRWEVAMDFSVTGTPAPGGGTFFPGDPVPDWDPWNLGWRPVNVSGNNLCAVSSPQDLPRLRVRGPYAWNSEVGGDRSSVDSGGVQVTGGTATISLPACS